MRENVKEFLAQLSDEYNLHEPILEIGSFQVEGQEGFADLRPIFAGKKFVGADLRPGRGVDVVSDASMLSFPDGSIGAVLMIDSLEHIWDCRTAFQDVFRVLKDGGVFVVSTVMNFPIHRHPSDYWRFTPDAISELLKGFDERVVFWQGRGDFPHTLIGLGVKGELQSGALVDIAEGIRERSGGVSRIFSPQAGGQSPACAEISPGILRDSGAEDDRYHSVVSMDANENDDPRVKILRSVPISSNVLEFGCASGHMSKVLKEDLDCAVTAVELNEKSAEKAMGFCEKVVVGDIEALDFEKNFKKKFDVAIFSDVLEHLKDPNRILWNVRDMLAPEGFVLASIPNVTHASITLQMMDGEFNYQALGILDRTHLRFFTRRGVEELFESSGYYIESVSSIRIDPRFSMYSVDEARYPKEALDHIRRNPDWDTQHFVVKAYPSGEGAAMKRLWAKMEDAQVALYDKRRTNLLDVENSKATIEALKQTIAALENDIKEKEAVVNTIMSKLPIRAYMKIKRIMKMNRD